MHVTIFISEHQNPQDRLAEQAQKVLVLQTAPTKYNDSSISQGYNTLLTFKR